jgi:phosphoserine phosphatase RsbU/P
MGSASPGSLEGKLRDIRSLTDAALRRLTDEELLAELTVRTRAILQADTAAVLLLDAQSGLLAVAAAAGLEEEVSQGVRIPAGRGFAGRIAAERRPLILDRVDHTTVLSPVLLEKGIQALMGVPLVAGGQVLGVLHVGSLTTRRFTAQDVELLQLAGDRAAMAVQSMQAQEDRVAAAALRRSLVPGALPAIAGAAMAARYVPGTGMVGGDWYDMFILPSGHLGFVIGDVAGSGLPAATIMGRMRSTLRSYALQTTDPAEVLSRLDRSMQHFEPEAVATMLYGVAPPELDQMEVSSAGHLPPILAQPGEPAVPADVIPDTLIGADSDVQRHVTTMEILPGTLVCFYTDGLIERRWESIDHGLKRLCQTITAQPPDAACSSVMAALVGHNPAPDDIALVMFRRNPPGA